MIRTLLEVWKNTHGRHYQYTDKHEELGNQFLHLLIQSTQNDDVIIMILYITCL